MNFFKVFFTTASVVICSQLFSQNVVQKAPQPTVNKSVTDTAVTIPS